MDILFFPLNLEVFKVCWVFFPSQEKQLLTKAITIV